MEAPSSREKLAVGENQQQRDVYATDNHGFSFDPGGALVINESEYDLVVIGTGPAGQKGAIAAAKAHKRVAIIDRAAMIGGVSAHTGTIPSKSIREAIFQLTGFAVKARYGSGPRRHREISLQDVSSRVSAVVERETEVVREQLTRNGIDIYQGTRCFSILTLSKFRRTAKRLN